MIGIISKYNVTKSGEWLQGNKLRPFAPTYKQSTIFTSRLTYEDRNKKKEAKEYKVWEAIQMKAKENNINATDGKVEALLTN